MLNFQPCCGSCLSSCDVSVLGKRFAVHTKMTDLHLLNEFTFEMAFSLESVCFFCRVNVKAMSIRIKLKRTNLDWVLHRLLFLERGLTYVAERKTFFRLKEYLDQSYCM